MGCSRCHTRPAASPGQRWCCPGSGWLQEGQKKRGKKRRCNQKPWDEKTRELKKPPNCQTPERTMLDVFHVQVQRRHQDSHRLRALVVEELHHLKNEPTGEKKRRVCVRERERARRSVDQRQRFIPTTYCNLSNFFFYYFKSEGFGRWLWVKATKDGGRNINWVMVVMMVM